MSKKQSSATDALKKISRHLLATTCLTAAAAHGATITESSVSGADFGNSFGAANVLPVGTTEVIGAINPSSDFDFFRFSGLQPGGGYSLAGFYEAGTARFGVEKSDQTFLNALTSNPASLSGVIPTDGILVVQVANNEAVMNYDLTLTAPLASTGTPEPSTAAGVALGLAGAWALRRNKAK